MYLGTDAIADRDLGFAIARRALPTGPSNSLPPRTETSNSVVTSQANTSGVLAQPPTSSQTHKRAASPDHRKRDEGRSSGPPGGGGGGGGGSEYASGHKRARPQSPNRERETRWDGPSRRRFSPPPPPVWERDDRSGAGGGPQRGRDGPRGGPPDRDEDKGAGRQVQLPGVLSWFIGELPAPASFDGGSWSLVPFQVFWPVANMYWCYRPRVPDG